MHHAHAQVHDDDKKLILIPESHASAKGVSRLGNKIFVDVMTSTQSHVHVVC